MSCAEQNSRVSDGDGVYKELNVWEVAYERIDLSDELLKFDKLFN